MTHTKSRDKFKGDAFVAVARHVPFIEHYVKTIRLVFMDKFETRKGEPERERMQRISALFLGPNGRRYEDYDCVPLISSVITKVRVTVTVLRKLVTTYAVKHFTKEEVSVMERADTHSNVTLERYYVKEDARASALGAIRLLERSFPGQEVVAAAAAAKATAQPPVVMSRPPKFDVKQLIASSRQYRVGQKRGREQADPDMESDADADMAASAEDEPEPTAPERDRSPSLGSQHPPSAMRSAALGPTTTPDPPPVAAAAAARVTPAVGAAGGGHPRVRKRLKVLSTQPLLTATATSDTTDDLAVIADEGDESERNAGPALVMVDDDGTDATDSTSCTRLLHASASTPSAAAASAAAQPISMAGLVSAAAAARPAPTAGATATSAGGAALTPSATGLPQAAASAESGPMAARTRRQRRPKPGVIGDGVEVRASTIAGAGFGLFATRDYGVGDAVSEYDGEVIAWDEGQELRKLGEGYHIGGLETYYTCIDGRGLKPNDFGRGGGSFANDGCAEIKANVEFFKDKHNKFEAGGRRTGIARPVYLFIVAKRAIVSGEEIFVSYGRGYPWPPPMPNSDP